MQLLGLLEVEVAAAPLLKKVLMAAAALGQALISP